MKKILATGLTIGLLFSGAASAAFVAPDSATVLAGGTFAVYYDVSNTIDGSGLNVHNESGVLTYPSAGDSHFSNLGNTSSTIQYSFNSPTDISAFYLWNGGTVSSSNWGVKNFALEFFNGATSLGSTSTLTATSIQSAPHAADIFTGFQYANVTDVQLQAFNNYGSSNYVSINEVGFNTSPVPVPAAVWLFGSGLIALLGLKRKRATAFIA